MNAASVLVVALTVVALLQLLFPTSKAWAQLLLSPWSFWERGEVWRLVTYSFVHSPDSLWHVGVNALALWIFGRPLAAQLETRPFLALYFLCAGGGGLVAMGWPLVVRAAGITIDPFVSTAGASGAVLGVVVADSLRSPRREIALGFWLPPIRALYVALFLLILPFAAAAPHISWAAHLGGVATALGISLAVKDHLHK